MKALVLNEVKQPLVLKDQPNPKANYGQVIVNLKAAALNRRDYWIKQGLYPGIHCPIVLGSDGVGTTEKGMEVRDVFPGAKPVLCLQ